MGLLKGDCRGSSIFFYTFFVEHVYYLVERSVTFRLMLKKKKLAPDDSLLILANINLVILANINLLMHNIVRLL